jgi:hypothetical protein
MLSKLAKIANRLDSIGLTKEADVLDAFIRKVAASDNIELVAADIANNINDEYPGIGRDDFAKEFVRRLSGSTAKPSVDFNHQWSGNAAEAMALKQWNLLQSKVSHSDKSSVSATGWEKYIVAAGTIGNAVKEAWAKYTQSGAAGVDSSFKSFTSWYNNQLKNVWGGDHKSPTEVIKLISERTTAQAMAGSHYDASSPSALVSGTPANKPTSTPASIGATRPDPFAEVDESAQRKIDQGFSNPAESLEYLRKK